MATAETPYHANHDGSTEVGKDAIITIRWSMTAITALLLIAGLLTAWIAKQYRLVLLCFWIVVWFVWMGLAWVLQIATRQRRVFHPAVEGAAGWFASHWKDLADDCRDVSDSLLLLLANGEKNNCDATDTSASTRKRPRTLLFRAIVGPILRPLAALRRRRKGRDDSRGNSNHSTTRTGSEEEQSFEENNMTTEIL